MSTDLSTDRIEDDTMDEQPYLQSSMLLAFLGNSKYETVRYRLSDDFEWETAFCPVAIARAQKVDCFKLLATKEAWRVHAGGLSSACRAAGVPEPELIDIPSGQNEEELRAVFEALRSGTMAPQAQMLIIDITHGFRAQSFFASAIVQYLQSLHKSASVRLFYGAFEARDRETKVTPVWELTWYTELVALNAAIHVFLDTGHATNLVALLDRLGRNLNRSWALGGRSGKQPQFSLLAKRLREFTEAVDAVRIGELLLPQSKKQPSLTRALLDAIERARTAYAHLPLLEAPLQRLAKKIQALDAELDDLAGALAKPVLAALARLYLEWGRLPEASIVLREGWTCLYATQQAARPGKGFDQKARREADRYFTSTHPEMARRIAEVRNDVLHGGFNANPLPAKTIRGQLNNLLEEFAQSVIKPSQTKLGVTWFVSRHPGAIEWAAQHGIRVDRQVDHLNVEEVQPGDTVIGTLPVHLAAEVCRRRGRYFNLSLNVPAEARGRELSTDELDRYGARIEEYEVRHLAD